MRDIIQNVIFPEQEKLNHPKKSVPLSGTLFFVSFRRISLRPRRFPR